jgi:hypothetical protein
MEESDLLPQIERILEVAGTPLLAREIATALKQLGIDADRATVNSSLYRRSQHVLVKDDEHRWSPLSSLALRVVDAAGNPLLAREIALELHRHGFKVDRARVNKSLYRLAQTALVKDDNHRWGRPPGSPRSLANRDVLPSGAPRPLAPMCHLIPNPRPVVSRIRARVSIAVVVGLLIAAIAILFKFVQ